MRRNRIIRRGGAADGRGSCWDAEHPSPKGDWNPVPCVGDGGGLDRGNSAKPWSRGPGSGPAAPETLHTVTTHGVQPGR